MCAAASWSSRAYAFILYRFNRRLGPVSVNAPKTVPSSRLITTASALTPFSLSSKFVA
jgi:hypothetical protein